MINEKARSIVDFKNITYGYGGCPISIQENNINELIPDIYLYQLSL